MTPRSVDGRRPFAEREAGVPANLCIVDLEAKFAQPSKQSRTLLATHPKASTSVANQRSPFSTFLEKLPIQFCSRVLVALCYVSASLSVAQEHDVLCRDGDGSFQAEFHTGVTVQVGAARAGQLATRACEATLSWNKNRNSLIAATKASQLDVDTFGVDLGMGVPVTTFQVKSSSNQCCMQYQIYSLEKPSRLLRIITGGSFFRAADSDLDGRVEIWTNDAAAIEGLREFESGRIGPSPGGRVAFCKRPLA